ncbi:MAG: alpha/beta hydrolase [Candidatus Adiutrix sp.]|nr:alpha/beta hydrolase [Candidatus Adiutrix sp.]
MAHNEKRSLFIPKGPKKGQWGRWLLARAAVFLVLFALLSVIGGRLAKDRLIFYPSDEMWAEPARFKANQEEIWLTTEAGDRLKAWYVPAPGGDAAKTVLVLQGNAGNMSMMTDRLIAFRSLGLNSLAVDYPGYGDSSGAPSEEGVYQAAEAAWRWVTVNKTKPEDVVIYGFSLGGGVASWLAERHPPAALVLDSTFTRLRDVPGYAAPWLKPYFYLVLGNDFDTSSRLGRLNCPLLVLHSPDDNVVPFALGLELFNSYQGGPKEMAVGAGGHMDFMVSYFAGGADGYREKLKKLLVAP